MNSRIQKISSYDKAKSFIQNSEGIKEGNQNINFLFSKNAENKFSKLELLKLRYFSLANLRYFTSLKPEKAQEFIQEYLLKALHENISGSQFDTQEISMYRRYLRELLNDWIVQYDESRSIKVREQVLDCLINQYESDNDSKILWTISSIGYRRKDIKEKLLDELENEINKNSIENKSVTRLICILDNLGYKFENQDIVHFELLKKIVSKEIQKETPDHLSFFALRYISSVENIEGIVELLVEAIRKENTLAIDVLMTTLINFSKQDSIEPKLIWGYIEDLKQNELEDASSILVMNSSILPECDTEEVTSYYLNEFEDERNDAAYHILSERINDCQKPKQLQNYKHFENHKVINRFKEFLTLDTESNTRGQTPDKRIKSTAPRLLNRIESKLTLDEEFEDLFNKAVVEETDNLLKKELIELFSCFQRENLPGGAHDWITDEFNEEFSSDDSDWAPRLASFKLAACTPSFSTLDSLLNFGYQSDGNTLQLTEDSLIEVSTKLAEEMPDKVLNMLLEAAEGNTSMPDTDIVASALKEVFRKTELENIEKRTGELLSMIERSSSDYFKSNLIHALYFIEADGLSSNVISKIKELSLNGEGRVKWRSIELLIKSEEIQDHPEVLDQIGLSLEGQKFELIKSGIENKWKVYLIGTLFEDSPSKSYEIFAELLRNTDYRNIRQLFGFLDRNWDEFSKEITSTIASSFIDRIRESQTSSQADTALFDFAVKHFSTEFFNEPWSDFWDDWLSDSKVALADAIAFNELEDQYKNDAYDLLKNLTRDEIYAVRRSAFRALSYTNYDKFRVYTEGLIFAEKGDRDNSLVSNRLGAEAFIWLKEQDLARKEDRKVDKKNGIYNRLEHHRDQKVREKFEKGIEIREDKKLAKAYLQEVREALSGKNEDILYSWKYGEALKELADDEILNNLKQMLDNEVDEPHVRLWFNDIYEDAEDHWDKITDEWPEPWKDAEGVIETSEGKLITEKLGTFDVFYHVWDQPGKDPSDLNTWEGIAKFQEQNGGLEIQKNLESVELQLELDDGRKGEIVPSKVNLQEIVFAGSGEFPS